MGLNLHDNIQQHVPHQHKHEHFGNSAEHGDRKEHLFSFFVNRYILCFIGIFTAPLAGTWSISFSLFSDPEPGDYNWIYLYKNGQQIPETRHYNGHSEDGAGYMGFTGGRNVFLSLDAGDTVELRPEHLGEITRRILICYEYVSK